MKRIYDGKSNGKIIFSEEEMNDIKESYLNKESSESIGKRYGVSHKLILRRIREMGIEVNFSRMIRKYNVDEHYFDEIDTPNKAYILGFLYADGHNGMSKGTITMSLEEGDVQILEDIRRELKSDKPLEYLDYTNKHDFGYTYKNQYRLNIFNVHMCKALEKLGMVPNKSLVLTFPNLKKDLIPHFIRGYFDGDGSLGVGDIKKVELKPRVSVSITSTESFCNSIVDIIQEELGVVARIADASCHNGITRALYITKQKDAMKFLNWIYQDAEMYLNRKHEIYEYYTNNLLIA